MADIPLKYAIPILVVAVAPLAYATVGPLFAALSPSSSVPTATHFTEQQANDTVSACRTTRDRLDSATQAQIDRVVCNVDFSSGTASIQVVLLRNKQGEKLMRKYVAHVEQVDKRKWNATNVIEGDGPKTSGIVFNGYDASRAQDACTVAAADTPTQFGLMLFEQQRKDCEVTLEGEKSAIVALSFMTNEQPSRLRKFVARVRSNPSELFGWTTTGVSQYD